MQIRKFIFMITVLLLTGVLAGCLNFESTEEKIYKELEEIVQLEAEFENQQLPLVELEKKEKAIYDEILSLGMKDFDRIVELADEAIALTEERQEMLDKERESIKTAEANFVKVKDLIGKIDDENLRTEAENLYETMNDRYSIHEQLYEKYSEGIELDRELYNLFKQEDVALDVLEPQIEKINNVYKEVYDLNEKFNKETENYNNLKVSFYQNAGLNIELEENKN